MNTTSHSTALEASSQWLQTRPGEACLIRVSAEQTGGLYSVVEIVSQPGDGTPLHVHANEDEYALVLEGTARIAYGEKVIDASAGESLLLKRGIPHAWANRTDKPMRLLMTCTPGGVEQALRLIAAQDMDQLMAIAEQLAVTVLGPTPF
ncbi:MULTISPECIES: cupin domain-containing protein [Enterobacteriaceae]|uniref:cupin domain-containing protein n=1 Tax=Enterobacteriaceae TaxID=543 RepID=UPI0014210563|nr:cupin domain-containing protein [Enterobacter sp. Ap-1006]NIF48899.1 cupin domain-containing protein [Enterobacter sp. Ap-1006]